MGRNLLLIIDPQNDFVNPDGSLYVDGAEDSIKNLCQWINENNKNIDEVFITQDTHMSYHIGHSCFWKEYPKPGTKISYQNVLESDFTPILSREEESSCDLFYDQEILDYFFELDNENKKHIIWPLFQNIKRKRTYSKDLARTLYRRFLGLVFSRSVSGSNKSMVSI